MSQAKNAVSKIMWCVKNGKVFMCVYVLFVYFCSDASLRSRRDGSMRRLADVRDDDDMNTYNGNSTQQM